MATIQHATTLWQDSPHNNFRKTRAPKIGNLPRRSAVDVDSNNYAPIGCYTTSEDETTIVENKGADLPQVVPLPLDDVIPTNRTTIPPRFKAGLQSKSFGSTNDEKIFNLNKLKLTDTRRVSIEKSSTNLQLNQYKLYETIGQGSYGVVKLAYNVEDNTNYAIKILSKRKLMKKSGIFGRLPPSRKNAEGPLAKIYREIAILKKLDHPNIVKLVEILDDPSENFLYLTFEYCERGQVLEIPTKKPLDEETARRYFRDVLLGLEYLHYQRIIHRDLKPANLLLSNDGRVQIADLGVCNEFEGNDAILSNSAGTPAFAPPETVARRHQFSGKAADIWSLGITLYAFVYGNVPFYDVNLLALNEKILNDDVSFPTSHVTTPLLKDLIRRMLIKNPKERINLQEIKEHPWVTENGKFTMKTEEENCRHLVEITEEDVTKCVTSIPKLDTLILIKHMLKKHSFQNPFTSSPRHINDASRRSYGRSGRSNSAPDSYYDDIFNFHKKPQDKIDENTVLSSSNYKDESDDKISFTRS